MVSKESLTIGITFDTAKDFAFLRSEPEDWDAEFAVSTAVDDIARAIEDFGFDVVLVGSGRRLLDRFAEIEKSIDIIFNIAEGYFGRTRESQIPAMLELAGIPYVGSDSYTLALSLNKWHTKLLAGNYGIRTPSFRIVRSLDEIIKCVPPDYPVMTKLCCEGSSKGLRNDSIALDKSALDCNLRRLLRTYNQPVLVEEFVYGKEIDVPIIGNNPSSAFGIVGITLDGQLELNNRFLTSDTVKSDAYGFEYPLRETFVPEAERMAVAMYNLLECRDFGRVDMRIDEEGRPYFLEINPYPFLGKHSSFNEVAAKTGIGYNSMIQMILQSALIRLGIRSKESVPSVKDEFSRSREVLDRATH